MNRAGYVVDHVDVRLLGAFAVTVDGAAVAPRDWPQRRASDLVKLLALAPGHRLTRERVLDALWPHLAPEAAAAALHKAAHYARRAMGDRDAVVVGGGTVALAPDAAVTTDAERFEADAAAPYGGELLPGDLYEEWTREARERLRALHADRLRAAGSWEALLAEDPADEEAHRALMRQAAACGDRAAAVRRFRALREELARLGAQPSAESLKLYRDVSRGPAVTAPVAPPEPMFGRAPTMAVALDRLDVADAGRGGVLLLCGESGSGKTRVAETVLAAAAGRRWHTLRGTAIAHRGALGAVVHAVAALLAERPDLLAHLSAAAVADFRGGGVPGAPAIGELLVCAAEERGCALLLDDLHAADEATVRLVEELAATAPGHRLLVIAGWRPSEGSSHLERVAAALEDQRLAAAVRIEPAERSAVPTTRYAVSSDGARIAYQVLGEGPPDIVLVPGFVSNVEHGWEMPAARRLFQRLAARGRLILWDKRGNGLSDPAGRAPGLDERMEDLAAVMATAGSERAVLFGVSEGGPMSILFAAEHPEAVEASCSTARPRASTATRTTRPAGSPTSPSGWPTACTSTGAPARCCGSSRRAAPPTRSAASCSPLPARRREPVDGPGHRRGDARHRPAAAAALGPRRRPSSSIAAETG